MGQGDQLAVQTIASMSGNPLSSELSPLGQASLSLAKRAIVIASGANEGDLLHVGEAIASDIMSAAQPIIENLVSDVVQEAESSGLTGVAQAIPIVAQAVGLIASVAEIFSEIAAAKKEAHAQFCKQNYTPIPSAPWGSGVGGQVLPTDLFHGADGGPHKGNTPDFNSCIDAMIGSGADPSYVKKQIQLTSQFGAVSPYKGIKGIPENVREQIKSFRHVLYLQKGDSYDGGKTLFPIFADLLLAQFRMKRVNGKYVRAISADDCSVDLAYQPFVDFQGLLHAWKRTAEPLYGVDKVKLAAIIKKATEPRIQAVVSLHHSTPQIDHVLALPSHERHDMPSDIDSEAIIQSIIAAAHGELDGGESVSGTGCGCGGVGAPTDKSVIIWRGGVPSGIKTDRGIIINDFAPHAKALASSFQAPQAIVGRDYFHTDGYTPGDEWDGHNDNTLPVFGTTYAWGDWNEDPNDWSDYNSYGYSEDDYY